MADLAVASAVAIVAIVALGCRGEGLGNIVVIIVTDIGFV